MGGQPFGQTLKSRTELGKGSLSWCSFITCKRFLRPLLYLFLFCLLSFYADPAPSATTLRFVVWCCFLATVPQFVYVNCKSVRKLEFLQKTINSAFAPCLAHLCGRGGADGQGVRRVRNSNASSGQKQVTPMIGLGNNCGPLKSNECGRRGFARFSTRRECKYPRVQCN